MSQEIELNPISFLTVGTVGPKGKRVFYLQAGDGKQVISLIVEKEQARALGEAIAELLDDLKVRSPEGDEGDINLAQWNMELRDPIDALFRIAQIGLGYDEQQNQVVIVAQELILVENEEDLETVQPRIVRLWGTRAQFRALSLYTARVVSKGRADPKQNGRIIYYWT